MSDVDIDDERNPSKTNDKGGKSSNKSIVTTAANSATTLLPRSIASAVSLITQSTSLTLRIGTYFGGAALGSARVTTLTGLELSRAVVEAILSRAGRDVAGYSQGEYGRSEAESILERSLAALHSTVTSTSFFAAAGFRLSEVALSSLSNLSQNLLYTLDAILGSTESSRAIAAIITLIRKEFSKKEDGEDSDIVGVGDLLVGSVGFALLQRWGRLNSERQMRESGGEVIIWDVVILDNGLRADVIGTQTTEYMQSIVNDDTISRPASFMDIDGPQETISAVERVRLQEGPSNEWESSNIQQLTDEEIRNYIMKQLPLGSHASVRTELVTAHTITVDIFDDDMAEITAPPGTMMVEERFHNDQESSDVAKRLPKHTLVFRTAFNESQSTNLRAEYFATASKKSDDITKTAIELTDTNKMKPANERVNKAAQPSPLEHHANEGRRRPRRITSSSALNNSDTPRNTFVKESFSKITQKVKAGPGEKSNIKSKDATKKEQTKGPSVLSKTSKSMGNSPQRKDLSGSTLASMNRPLPSLPVTDYPRYRSTPSPTASRVPQPNGAPSRAGLVPPNKDTESFVTHTDSYSIHSIDSRPGSASYTRTHTRSSSSLSRSRHEEAQRSPKHELNAQASPRSHGRSGSFVPSIYSIANGSETSLILAPRPRKSVYEDDSTIIGLNRNGLVPGIFPHNHLVKNIRRFCRFSSASYGSNALKVMGVQRDQTSIQYHNHENQEHGSFSSMTGLPPSTILLSSYVDPAGGSNSAGETESGFPLVHYLFLDHESKAVVLALRGTWGFEDILTDMTCDYDDLEWQGRNWKVHKGMHASARRLLEGGGKRVMVTIKAALEEFPDYGVIFCGHSLGGGVAALLATMISQPNVDISGPSFVTASALQAAKPLLITSSHQQEAAKTFSLPSNRPIHVYAYGPPACMSPFLRRATRGLVTTVVNGRDVVPTLSLGILHDLRNVALSFKKDTTDPKSHIQSRVWEGLRQSILNKFYVNQPPIPINAGEGLGEDTWAWSTLQSLRHEMMAPKLVPPGEVFVVETMRVLQRNPFTTTEGGSFSGGGTYSQLGRPATRVQLKFIRNVETYFGEMKFSSGMLGDHNPVRYEASLAALARGIIDD